MEQKWISRNHIVYLTCFLILVALASVVLFSVFLLPKKQAESKAGFVVGIVEGFRKSQEPFQRLPILLRDKGIENVTWNSKRPALPPDRITIVVGTYYTLPAFNVTLTIDIQMSTNQRDWTYTVNRQASGL